MRTRGVPVVYHHQNVLVPVVRSNGKFSRQIGRRPLRFGDGEGVTWEEGINSTGAVEVVDRYRGKEERSGGERLLPLSERVFRVLLGVGGE